MKRNKRGGNSQRHPWLAILVLAVLTLPRTAAGNDWSCALSAFYIDSAGQEPYPAATFFADRDALHLEVRYNYEDLETGSLFFGGTLSVGDEIALTVVPLFGFIAGNTIGVAPGAEVTLEWWRLTLYDESEYVLNGEERADNFFYAWVEATVSPTKWLRTGFVGQRTKVIETSLEFDRGLLVELAHRDASLGLHWFNPDRPDDRIFLLAVSYTF
ncbi:MAG TPA: hypothetical protein VNM87_06065 [Candidatus Udaeobacter sp.]|nr:hypothetical protein [Candidatus Udaeobacter sp.]